MSRPKTFWVRLNRLRTGVERFYSSMYKWGLAPSPNCKCGTTEKTEDHVVSSCLIHHVPRGTRNLQILYDAVDVGLTPPLPASNLDSTAALSGKRIDPWPWL